VISRHGAFKRDARYAELSPGERNYHEGQVALCYLDLRRPEQAIEVTRSWPTNIALGALLEARAAAQLDRPDACRASLGRALDNGFSDIDSLFAAPEFRSYSHEDWFLNLASQVWSRSGSVDAEAFAFKLSRWSQQELLTLRLVSADTQRPSGEIAVWRGKIRKSEIDRANGQTVLFAEGVDVKENLTVIDKEVTAFKKVHGGITPEYAETRTYESSFVPNGLLFIVKYGVIDEQLVSLENFIAFGRYSGRYADSDVPVLEAFFIAQQRPRERTESVR